MLEHLHRDALTGLLNYAGGIVQLQQAIAQAERYHTPLSLLMLDRDHNIHSVSDLPHLYTCVEVDRQVFQWDGAAYVLAEQCDDLKLQENSYRCR